MIKILEYILKLILIVLENKPSMERKKDTYDLKQMFINKDKVAIADRLSNSHNRHKRLSAQKKSDSSSE
jgi:hypothetical protein